MDLNTVRKAADVKGVLAGPPTAEGVKGTTLEVAKGAAMGAVTGGGWVGAARGAAVSFVQTKAGKRIIAGIGTALTVCLVAVPVIGLFAVQMVNSAAAYGNDYRAGQSVVASGQEASAVTTAQDAAKRFDIPWPLYLALTTVGGQKDPDLGKLRDLLARNQARSLATAGVWVDGKGLVPGETDELKATAEEEKTAFVGALTAFGLQPRQAEKVYATALKWAYGQTEDCVGGETKPGAGGSTDDPASPIQLEDGSTITLSDVQLANAEKIIGFASKIPAVTEDAIIISLMAAMTESALKNYANRNVPESLNYPHDAVGQDHDSVGFWQMRQHWGTTAELMNIEYQTKAFFGGPEGPNGGSPRGLFDIPGWDTMPKGNAAQAVEVSAFPDRYAANEPLARALLARFGGGMSFCDGGTDVGHAGEAGHPLGDPSYLVVSGYGPRIPGAGSSNHKGIDFGAGCNTPIYAIADGTVVSAGPAGGWGNAVVIDHGGGLSTRSAHMPNGGNWAQAGTKVKLGDQIGTVGTTGNSSGCHLHFETMMDGDYVDPGVVLKDMGVRLIWSSESNGIPPGAEMG